MVNDWLGMGHVNIPFLNTTVSPTKAQNILYLWFFLPWVSLVQNNLVIIAQWSCRGDDCA
jgi:hypothetical protein